MIECRTVFTKKNIKALSKYHTKKQKINKRKSVFIFVLGIFLFVLSVINTYGLWMKYHETESTIFIFSKSSVLFLLSIIILYTSIKGPEQKLYLELKNYFSETKTKYIDYIISEDGIHMIINDNSTLYKWISIEHIEFDDKFFYFTCNDKHSIIEKKLLSTEDKSLFENLINQNQIIYREFH